MAYAKAKIGYTIGPSGKPCTLLNLQLYLPDGSFYGNYPLDAMNVTHSLKSAHLDALDYGADEGILIESVDITR